MPRAHRVQDAVGALGVTGGAFVEAPGLLHPGPHLLGAIVGVLRIDAGGHDTAGRHDLDQVAAGMNLLAHRLHHFVLAVGDASHVAAVAAGHADHAAGRVDRRAFEDPSPHRVPHPEFQVVLAAAVADRGDTAGKALLRALQGGQGDVRGALLGHRRAGIGGTVEHQVDVAIEQPRQQGRAAGVDDFARETVELAERRHLADAAALDQNALALEPGPASVEQQASFEQPRHGLSFHPLISLP